MWPMWPVPTIHILPAVSQHWTLLINYKNHVRLCTNTRQMAAAAARLRPLLSQLVMPLALGLWGSTAQCLQCSQLLLNFVWWLEYFQTYFFLNRMKVLTPAQQLINHPHGWSWRPWNIWTESQNIYIYNGIYFERLRDFLMCRICSFAIKRLARCYNWYELSRKKEPVILRQCGIVLVISGIVDTNLGGVVDRNYLIRESV